MTAPAVSGTPPAHSFSHYGPPLVWNARPPDKPVRYRFHNPHYQSHGFTHYEVTTTWWCARTAPISPLKTTDDFKTMREFKGWPQVSVYGVTAREVLIHLFDRPTEDEAVRLLQMMGVLP